MKIMIVFVIIAVGLCGLCSQSHGQDTIRYRGLPGGGSLTLYLDEAGVVTSLVYSGDPEWLLKHDDERSDWSKYSKLESIVILQTYITKELLEYIATLKSVVDLDLSGHELLIPGEALEALGKMTWLKRLRIDDNGAGNSEPKHWEFISRLQNLEELSIDAESAAHAKLGLSSLRSLKCVSLNCLLNGVIDDELIKQLSALDELEFVALEPVQSPAVVLAALGHHIKIKRLHIYTTNDVTISDLAIISQMQNLEALFLTGRKLDSLSPFDKLKNLQELFLNFREFPKSEASISWKDMQNLKWLVLHFRGFPESEKFGFVANLPHLECLDVSGIPAPKTRSIEFLRHHPGIRKLNLWELDEQGIEVLASIPNLQSVTVQNTAESALLQYVQKRLPNVFFEGSPVTKGSK